LCGLIFCHRFVAPSISRAYFRSVRATGQSRVANAGLDLVVRASTSCSADADISCRIRSQRGKSNRDCLAAARRTVAEHVESFRHGYFLSTAAHSRIGRKLRIGDDWNAINIIAMSQSNPTCSKRAPRIIALDDVTALAISHQAQHQGVCRYHRQGIAARNSRFPAKVDPCGGRGDRPRYYPDVVDRPVR